jgi:cob(I)alamin adenosyltransferase
MLENKAVLSAGSEPSQEDISARKSERGLVQVFTGNGKGKTSAAVGAIVRAAGHGFKVLLISFMKGNYAYGEYKALALLPGVEIAQFGLRKLADPASVDTEEKAQAHAALETARQAVMSEKYDLVVLDEINIVVNFKLIELDDVIKLAKDKPHHVELILTGRYADRKLMETADLVTEMVKVKHPFDAGIKARKGIEY